MNPLLELIKRRALLFCGVTLALNFAMLAVTIYLTHFAAPVIVEGHRLDNCTSVQEPDRIVWTCNP
jgi:hypothetical protein